jgi:hypothetical protein
VVATSQADTTKSASAAVTVTAPTPTFSTTASTAATEGTPYTYSIVAVDPAGSALSYALTTAPVGATLSGNTITWTPTSAQSRVPDNFNVTITTGAGGTASQSWTVTPIGTIYGSCIDTYWTVNGAKTPVVNDLTTSTFAALVPQSDGSVLTLPGTGTSTGMFTIPNVPAGYYWLQMNYPGTITWAYQNNWTSSSSFDCGADTTGRPNTTQVTASLNWNVTGLAPWSEADYDQLGGYSPNANSWLSPQSYPSDSSTSLIALDSPEPMTQIDPSQGDITYLIQTQSIQSDGSYVWSAVSTGVVSPSLSVLNPGDIGNVTATMVPMSSSQTMDMNIDFASYVSAETNANSSFTASDFEGAVWPQVFVTDRSTDSKWNQQGASLQSLYFDLWSGSNPLPSGVQDFGEVNLGTQFPATWPTVYMSWLDGNTTTQVTGAASPTNIETQIGHLSPTLPTSTQPDKSVMTPIQNPTINGASFYNNINITAPAPLTLSWSAPTGLAPIGYQITLLNIDPSTGYTIGSSAVFYTAKTSMTVPSQALPSGTYILVVEAMADSLANIETAPFHYGLTEAWADAVSGAITYIGTATSNPFLPVFPDENAIKTEAKKSTHLNRRQMQQSFTSKNAQKTVVKP